MKLPDITYSRATTMKSASPRQALVKAQGVREIAGALTDTFTHIAEIDNERKVKRATLQTQNDLAMLDEEFGSREFYTAEEIERFGLSDQVTMTDGEDMDGNPVRREIIPSYEVYPMLVNRQYQESIRAHGQSIRRPKDREDWSLEHHSRRISAVSGAMKQSQRMAVEARYKEGMLDIAEALRAKNWEGANEMTRELYKGNPAMRDEALYENSLAQLEGSADDIDRMLSDGVRSARIGNDEGVAASTASYRALVSDLRKGGAIPTQEAADKMVDDFQKQIAVEQIRTDFRQGLDSDADIAASAEGLASFRDEPLEGFTVKEQEGVFDLLVQDLNTHLSLRNKHETSEDEATKEMQEATYTNLYIGLLTNKSDSGDVLAALTNKTINQSQGESLIGIYNNRGRGVDDYPLISQINIDIDNGRSRQQIEQTIAQNTGTRLTESTAVDLLKQVKAYYDDESPLQTNRAKRAKDFITKSIRVTGIMGSLDTEAERRLAQAHRDYSNAVMSGDDPFRAADKLVDRDSYQRAPEPRYGTKDNLDAAIDGLEAAMAAEEIDDDTFNYEYALIEELREMKANIDAFEKAKKDND